MAQALIREPWFVFVAFAACIIAGELLGVYANWYLPLIRPVQKMLYSALADKQSPTEIEEQYFADSASRMYVHVRERVAARSSVQVHELTSSDIEVLIGEIAAQSRSYPQVERLVVRAILFERLSAVCSMQFGAYLISAMVAGFVVIWIGIAFVFLVLGLLLLHGARQFRGQARHKAFAAVLVSTPAEKQGKKCDLSIIDDLRRPAGVVEY